MASRKSKRMTKKRNTKKRNNKIQRRNKIKNKKTKNKKKNINRKYRKTRIMRGGMDEEQMWAAAANDVEMLGDLLPTSDDIIGVLSPLDPATRNRIYINIEGREERVMMYDSFSVFKQQLQAAGLLTLAADEDIIFMEKKEDGNMGDVVRYEDLNTPHNLLKTWNVCKTGSHGEEKKSNGQGGVTNTAPVDVGEAGGGFAAGIGSFFKKLIPGGGAAAQSNPAPMEVEE